MDSREPALSWRPLTVMDKDTTCRECSSDSTSRTNWSPTHLDKFPPTADARVSYNLAFGSISKRSRYNSILERFSWKPSLSYWIVMASFVFSSILNFSETTYTYVDPGVIPSDLYPASYKLLEFSTLKPKVEIVYLWTTKDDHQYLTPDTLWKIEGVRRVLVSRKSLRYKSKLCFVVDDSNRISSITLQASRNPCYGTEIYVEEAVDIPISSDIESEMFRKNCEFCFIKRSDEVPQIYLDQPCDISDHTIDSITIGRLTPHASGFCPLGWLQHGRKCWVNIQGDGRTDMNFFAAQQGCLQIAANEGYKDSMLANFGSITEAMTFAELFPDPLRFWVNVYQKGGCTLLYENVIYDKCQGIREDKTSFVLDPKEMEENIGFSSQPFGLCDDGTGPQSQIRLESKPLQCAVFSGVGSNCFGVEHCWTYLQRGPLPNPSYHINTLCWVRMKVPPSDDDLSSSAPSNEQLPDIPPLDSRLEATITSISEPTSLPLYGFSPPFSSVLALNQILIIFQRESCGVKPGVYMSSRIKKSDAELGFSVSLILNGVAGEIQDIVLNICYTSTYIWEKVTSEPTTPKRSLLMSVNKGEGLTHISKYLGSALFISQHLDADDHKWSCSSWPCTIKFSERKSSMLQMPVVNRRIRLQIERTSPDCKAFSRSEYDTNYSDDPKVTGTVMLYKLSVGKEISVNGGKRYSYSFQITKEPKSFPEAADEGPWVVCYCDGLKCKSYTTRLGVIEGPPNKLGIRFGFVGGTIPNVEVPKEFKQGIISSYECDKIPSSCDDCISTLTSTTIDKDGILHWDSSIKIEKNPIGHLYFCACLEDGVSTCKANSEYVHLLFDLDVWGPITTLTFVCHRHGQCPLIVPLKDDVEAPGTHWIRLGETCETPITGGEHLTGEIINNSKGNGIQDRIFSLKTIVRLDTPSTLSICYCFGNTLNDCKEFTMVGSISLVGDLDTAMILIHPRYKDSIPYIPEEWADGLSMVNHPILNSIVETEGTGSQIINRKRCRGGSSMIVLVDQISIMQDDGCGNYDAMLVLNVVGEVKSAGRHFIGWFPNPLRMIADTDKSLNLCSCTNDECDSEDELYSNKLGYIRTQGPLKVPIKCVHRKECSIQLFAKLDIFPNYKTHFLRVSWTCTGSNLLDIQGVPPSAEFLGVSSASVVNQDSTAVLQFSLDLRNIDRLPDGLKLCWCGSLDGFNCRLSDYTEIGTIESKWDTEKKQWYVGNYPIMINVLIPVGETTMSLLSSSACGKSSPEFSSKQISLKDGLLRWNQDDMNSYKLKLTVAQLHVCGCDPSYGTCLAIEDFHLDLGLISVMGPLMDTHASCAFCSDCEISILSSLTSDLLEKTDPYAVLASENCDSLTDNPPNPGGSSGQWLFNLKNTKKDVKDFIPGRTLWTMQFEAVGMFLPRVQNLKLCWCSNKKGACVKASDYTLEVGDLTVSYLPPNYIEIQVGRTLELSFPPEKLLKDLKAVIYEKTTCGGTIYLDGGMYDYDQKALVFSNKIVKNRLPQLMALCICDVTKGCTDYPFLISNVQITGPMTGNAVECEYGTLCSINIPTYLPSNSEIQKINLRVARKCTSNPKDLIPELPSNGELEAKIQENHSDIAAKILNVKFLRPIMKTEPLVQICFCATTKDYKCGGSENWNGQIATITMTGTPAPSHFETIPLGEKPIRIQVTFSGVKSAILNSVECGEQDVNAPYLLGGIVEGSLDKSWITFLDPFMYNQPGRVIRLCGGDESSDDNLYDYDVELEILRVQGPLTGLKKTCTSFTNCLIEIEEHYDQGVEPPLDEILWISENCNKLPTPQDELPNGGKMEIGEAAVVYEGYVTRKVKFFFKDALATPEKRYSLCWSYKKSKVYTSADFTPIGPISGIQLVCDFAPCSLNLKTWNYKMEKDIDWITLTETKDCKTTSIEGYLSDDQHSIIFDEHVFSRAFVYEICYCHGTTCKQSPETSEQRLNIGKLLVTGAPEEKNTFDCDLTHSCRIAMMIIKSPYTDPDVEHRLSLFEDYCGGTEIPADPIDSSRSTTYNENVIEGKTFMALGEYVYTEFIWKVFAKASTGYYSICLCRGSRISRTCSGNASINMNYRQNVGLLRLRRTQLCFSNAECMIPKASAIGLIDKPHYLFISKTPCNEKSTIDDRSVDGFPSKPVVIENDEAFLGLVRAEPGTYEVCFCIGGSDCKSELTDFNRFWGDILIHGVLPFKTDCALGTHCNINDLVTVGPDIEKLKQINLVFAETGHCTDKNGGILMNDKTVVEEIKSSSPKYETIEEEIHRLGYTYTDHIWSFSFKFSKIFDYAPRTGREIEICGCEAQNRVDCSDGPSTFRFPIKILGPGFIDNGIQFVGTEFTITSFPNFVPPVDRDKYFVVLSGQKCPNDMPAFSFAKSITSNAALEFGLLPSTATTYQLCYCNNDDGKCFAEDDKKEERTIETRQFSISLGSVSMKGPKVDPTTFFVYCSTSIQCRFKLPWSDGSTSYENSMVGVFKDGCGERASIDGDIPQWMAYHRGFVGSNVEYEWPTPFLKSNLLYLCFCNLGSTRCLEKDQVKTNYVVSLGRLQIDTVTLHAPLELTIGQSFHLTLSYPSGTEAYLKPSVGDRFSFLLIPQGKIKSVVECGKLDRVYVSDQLTLKGKPLDAVAPPPTYSTDFSRWEQLLLTPADSGESTPYAQICFCSNTAASCDKPESYVFSGGIIPVTGPTKVNRHLTCSIGAVCPIPAIEGMELTAADEIILRKNCNREFESSREVKATGRTYKVVHMIDNDGKTWNTDELNALSLTERRKIKSNSLSLQASGVLKPADNISGLLNNWYICWERTREKSNLPATIAVGTIDMSFVKPISVSCLYATEHYSCTRTVTDPSVHSLLSGKGYIYLYAGVENSEDELKADAIKLPYVDRYPVIANATKLKFQFTDKMKDSKVSTFTMKFCLEDKCDNPEALMPLGILTYYGPGDSVATISCTLGRICNIKLSGFNMDKSPLDFVKLGTDCSMNNGKGILLTDGWQLLDRRGSISPSYNLDLFSTDLRKLQRLSNTLDGDIVRLSLCFCDLNGEMNHDTCGKPENLTVKLSILTIRGPYSSNKVSQPCRGAECDIKISGTGYQAKDRLVWKLHKSTEQPCREAAVRGVDGSVVLFSPEAEDLATFKSVNILDKKVASEEYDVCWCGVLSPEDTSCDTADSIVFGVLVGIMPLESDSTGLYLCPGAAKCVVPTIFSVTNFEKWNRRMVAKGSEMDDRALTSEIKSKGVRRHLLDYDVKGFLSSRSDCSSNEYPLSLISENLNGDVLALSWEMPSFDKPTDKIWFICCKDITEKHNFSVLAVKFVGAWPIGPLDVLVGRPYSVKVDGVDLTRDSVMLTTGECGKDTSESSTDFVIMEGEFNEKQNIFTWVNHLIIHNKKDNGIKGCACDPSTSCSLPKHFPNQFTSLIVLGPLTEQSLECFVGSNCRLSVNTKTLDNAQITVRLAKDCGNIPDTYSKLPDNGIMVEAATTDVDITVEFKTLMTTLPDTYRICVCIYNWNSIYLDPWVGRHCLEKSNFNLDVGVVKITGPHGPISASCYSALACIINFPGLEGDDIVLLAEEPCSSPHLAQFPKAVANGGVLNFGVIGVATQFRMCYCNSRVSVCDDTRNYVVDVGVLVSYGPILENNWICGSGKQCIIDLHVFSEVGKVSKSRVAIYEGGCGDSAKEIPALSKKFGNDYGRGFLTGTPISIRKSTWRLSSDVTQVAFTWKKPLLLVSGEYVICYCEEDDTFSRCSVSADGERTKNYTLKVGELKITGMDRSITYACITNGPCIGPEVSFGSSIFKVALVANVNTCSEVHDIEKYRPKGLFENDGDATIIGRRADFGVTSSYTARYNICICVGRCDSSSYALDGGHLIVYGPVSDPLSIPNYCQMGGTCSISLYTIMKTDWKNDQWRIAIFSDKCGSTASEIPELEDNLQGQSLNPEVTKIDMTAVDDKNHERFINKWKNSPLFHDAVFKSEARLLTFTWTKDLEISGGIYPICLCTDNENCILGSVTAPFNFLLFELKYYGPDMFNYKTWKSGLEAQIQFKYLKSEPDDRHIFALTTTKCGSSGKSINEFDQIWAISRKGVIKFPNLTTPSVKLVLCYCNRMFRKCEVDNDEAFKEFTITLGKIVIEGPLSSLYNDVPQCYTQGKCSLKWGFSNSFKNFPSKLGYFEIGCGTKAVIPWGTKEKLVSVSEEGIQLTSKQGQYDFSLKPNDGGDFFLCYCDISLDCNKVHNFNVLLSTMRVIGPQFPPPRIINMGTLFNLKVQYPKDSKAKPGMFDKISIKQLSLEQSNLFSCGQSDTFSIETWVTKVNENGTLASNKPPWVADKISADKTEWSRLSFVKSSLIQDQWNPVVVFCICYTDDDTKCTSPQEFNVEVTRYYFTGPISVSGINNVDVEFGKELNLQSSASNWGNIVPKSAIILIPAEQPEDGIFFPKSTQFCGALKSWFVEGPIWIEAEDEDWSGSIEGDILHQAETIKNKYKQNYISLASENLIVCWCAVDKYFNVGCDHLSQYRVTLSFTVKSHGFTPSFKQMILPRSPFFVSINEPELFRATDKIRFINFDLDEWTNKRNSHTDAVINPTTKQFFFSCKSEANKTVVELLDGSLKKDPQDVEILPHGWKSQIVVLKEGDQPLTNLQMCICPRAVLSECNDTIDFYHWIGTIYFGGPIYNQAMNEGDRQFVDLSIEGRRLSTNDKLSLIPIRGEDSSLPWVQYHEMCTKERSSEIVHIIHQPELNPNGVTDPKKTVREKWKNVRLDFNYILCWIEETKLSYPLYVGLLNWKGISRNHLFTAKIKRDYEIVLLDSKNWTEKATLRLIDLNRWCFDVPSIANSYELSFESVRHNELLYFPPFNIKTKSNYRLCLDKETSTRFHGEATRPSKVKTLESTIKPTSKDSVITTINKPGSHVKVDSHATLEEKSVPSVVPLRHLKLLDEDPEKLSKSLDIGSLTIRNYESYSAAQLGIPSHSFPYSMHALTVSSEEVYIVVILECEVISLNVFKESSSDSGPERIQLIGKTDFVKENECALAVLIEAEYNKDAKHDLIIVFDDKLQFFKFSSQEDLYLLKLGSPVKEMKDKFFSQQRFTYKAGVLYYTDEQRKIIYSLDTMTDETLKPKELTKLDEISGLGSMRSFRRTTDFQSRLCLFGFLDIVAISDNTGETAIVVTDSRRQQLLLGLIDKETGSLRDGVWTSTFGDVNNPSTEGLMAPSSVAAVAAINGDTGDYLLFVAEYVGSRIVILFVKAMKELTLLKIVAAAFPVGLSVTNIVAYQAPTFPMRSKAKFDIWLVMSGQPGDLEIGQGPAISDGLMILANTRDLFQLIVNVKYTTDELVLFVGQEANIQAKVYDFDGKGIPINDFKFVSKWPKGLTIDPKSGNIGGKPVELLEEEKNPQSSTELWIEVFSVFDSVPVSIHIAVRCPAGTYFDTKGEKCIDCQAGSYRDKTLPSTSCLECGKNRSTAGSGATDKSRCQCQKGFKFATVSGDCLECDEGTYKDAVGDTGCTGQCDEGKISTSKVIGAKTKEELGCRCREGFWLDPASNTCDSCPIGFFCPGGDYKVACPDCTSTVNKSSKHPEDCLCAILCGRDTPAAPCKRCDSHHFKLELKNAPCEACPAHSFADLDQHIRGCTQCDRGYQKVGSTCSACNKGEFCPGSSILPDQTENKVSKGIAVFNSRNYCGQDSNEKYLTSLEAPALFSPFQCRCEKGFSAERDDVSLCLTCIPCPEDTFYPNIWNGENCIRCPIFTSTKAKTQMTDIAFCHPEPGNYRNLEGTQGTSSTDISFDCKKNTAIIETEDQHILRTASWSEALCKEECFRNEFCTGFIYDENEDDSFEPPLHECSIIVLGDPQWTEKTEDSWKPSNDHTIICLTNKTYVNQFRWRRYRIEICPKDHYCAGDEKDPDKTSTDPNSWETTSISKCPLNSTTEGVGKSKLTDCICASGTELKEHECELCEVNTYRTSGEELNCISCPQNFTTLSIGTTTPEDCVCKPSKYYVAPIDGGAKIEGVCVQCPQNHYCPGGRERNSSKDAMPKPCPLGSRIKNGETDAVSIDSCLCEPGFGRHSKTKDKLENVNEIDKCTKCRPGFYKGILASIGCIESCMLSSTSLFGMISKRQCYCLPNYWFTGYAPKESDAIHSEYNSDVIHSEYNSDVIHSEYNECEECPIGAHCPGGLNEEALSILQRNPHFLDLTNDDHKLPYPAADYYPRPQYGIRSARFVQCPTEGSCLGGINPSTYCRHGHRGVSCDDCINDYSRESQATNCGYCSTLVYKCISAVIRFIAYASFVIMLASLQVGLVKNPLAVDGILVRILMNTYLTLMLTCAVEQRGTKIHPIIVQIYQDMYGKVIFEFGRSVDYQCFLGGWEGISPLHRWLYAVMAEILFTSSSFIIALTLSCWAIRIFYRLIYRKKIQKLEILQQYAAKLSESRDYLIGASADFCKNQLDDMRIFGVFRYTDHSFSSITKFFADMIPLYVISGVLFYLPVTYHAFQLIKCAPLDLDPDAVLRFAHNVALECDSKDSVVVVAKVLGWITLALWSVLTPIFIIFWFHFSRAKLSNTAFRYKFGFLYDGYNYRCVTMWEWVIFMRKFTVAFVLGYCHPQLYDYSFKMTNMSAGGLMISCVALLAQMTCVPFKEVNYNILNRMEFSSLMICSITYVVLLALYAFKSETAGVRPYEWVSDNIIALIPLVLTAIFLVRYIMILFVEAGRCAHYSIERLDSSNLVFRGFSNIVTYGYNRCRRSKEAVVRFNPQTYDIELRARKDVFQLENEEEQARNAMILQKKWTEELNDPFSNSDLTENQTKYYTSNILSVERLPTKRRRPATAGLLGPHRYNIAREMGVSRANRAYLVTCIAEALTALIVEQQCSAIRGSFLEFVFRLAFCYVQNFRIRHLVQISVDDIRSTLTSVETMQKSDQERKEPTISIWGDGGITVQPSAINELEPKNRFGYLKTLGRAQRNDGRLFDILENLNRTMYASDLEHQKWIALNSRGNPKAESKYVNNALESQNAYLLINWLLDDDQPSKPVTDTQNENRHIAIETMEKELLESMGSTELFVDPITLPELHLALEKMKQSPSRMTQLYEYFETHKKEKENHESDNLRRDIDQAMEKLENWQPDLKEGNEKASATALTLVQWFCLKEENEVLMAELNVIEEEVESQREQVLQEIRAVQQILEIEEGLEGRNQENERELLNSLEQYETQLIRQLGDKGNNLDLKEILARIEIDKENKRLEKIKQQGSIVIIDDIEGRRVSAEYSSGEAVRIGSNNSRLHFGVDDPQNQWKAGTIASQHFPPDLIWDDGVLPSGTVGDKRQGSDGMLWSNSLTTYAEQREHLPPVFVGEKRSSSSDDWMSFRNTQHYSRSRRPRSKQHATTILGRQSTAAKEKSFTYDQNIDDAYDEGSLGLRALQSALDLQNQKERVHLGVQRVSLSDDDIWTEGRRRVAGSRTQHQPRTQLVTKTQERESTESGRKPEKQSRSIEYIKEESLAPVRGPQYRLDFQNRQIERVPLGRQQTSLSDDSVLGDGSRRLSGGRTPLNYSASSRNQFSPASVAEERLLFAVPPQGWSRPSENEPLFFESDNEPPRVKSLTSQNSFSGTPSRRREADWGHLRRSMARVDSRHGERSEHIEWSRSSDRSRSPMTRTRLGSAGTHTSEEK